MLLIQPAFQAFLLLLLLSTCHAKAIPTSSAATGPSIRLPLVDYPRRHLQTGGANKTVTSTSGDIHSLYAVTISVGTPPQRQSLVMDTGVDDVWLQCQPCQQCYSQDHQIFDPSNSTSFISVPCTVPDPASPSDCELLDESNRWCDSNNICNYEYKHGESHPHITKGILATENILFGETTITNMTIGCGRSNEGFEMTESGILGLGGGPLSFVGRKLGGAFTYCLGTTYRPGWLDIGRNFPNDTTWLPLLTSIKYPNLYYVGLESLLVGGEKVTMKHDDTFRIDPETGEGGVIINSGVSVTYLPKDAYEPFRDMFIAKTDTKKLNITGPFKHGNLDACYFADGLPDVPTVSFFFSGGLTLNLPSTNSLVVEDRSLPRLVYCFAFAPLSITDYGMIGSIAQQEIRISINGLGSIGFGPDGC